MNNNDKLFLGNAIIDCTKRNIQVVFLPKEFVKADGVDCSGYFDSTDKKLFIASRRPQKDWYSTFIHEYCHFQQWYEGSPLFMEDCELDTDMWDWLNGIDIPMARVKKSIRAYQALELDAEKRVVRHIENYNLSIHKGDYIRGANIYVLFYEMVHETRKWYKTIPYKNKKIIKMIPEEFLKSYSTVPEKFREIVLKECI